MKRNAFAILKSLGLTVGLNALLLGVMLFFSHMVHRESGQALLFFTVTLLLVIGVCLFAAIPTDKRGILWGCFGVSLPLHLVLSVISVLVYGNRLSESWPGSQNLAWLLFLLMVLTAWVVSVFTVTAVRSNRIGRVVREDKRQVKRARKGYRKEYPPMSPARARTLAVFRGFLWVLWLHLSTGLVFWLLEEAGASDTMLSYIAFPVLWCLFAAAYGLHDRENRLAYALTAAITNIALFTLSTLFLTVYNTPPIKFRYVLHLDSILTEPFSNPEQLLSLSIFLLVWVAMLIFGIAHRKRKTA